MNVFEMVDFGMLQSMVYPIIKMTTGIDAQGMVAGRASSLRATGDALGELAAIFDMAADAADDGILTNAEINALIDEAKDLPDAYESVRLALMGTADDGE